METQTYLVFLRNMQTMEDFSVATEATSKYEAQNMVLPRYPTPAYMLLTSFSTADLQTMIDDAPRWPGVASTVQPPLEQLLARVTAGTKLPPLHRGQTPAQAASTEYEAPTGARIQSKSDVVPGAMANQAKAALYASVPEVSTYTYQPPARKAPASAPVQGRSVVDVLKALRS